MRLWQEAPTFVVPEQVRGLMARMRSARNNAAIVFRVEVMRGCGCGYGGEEGFELEEDGYMQWWSRDVSR